MSIANSTISNNQGSETFGVGIANGGTITITNSTVSGNRLFAAFNGTGISNGGTISIINSTISGNVCFSASCSGGGGIDNRGRGSVELENTILALNIVEQGGFPPGIFVPNDCIGALTSLGNHVIGDPTGCTINLQPTDLTGDPGLGAFVDDGAPRHGRFPLLAASRAIDAGNDAACPPTDQLDTQRDGPCDIGAVEFYPVVNDLVALANITTAFDPTPVPGGPAGTFHITTDFANTSSQAIVNPFAEVVDLTGGNLLLNADGGAGGVGARLTSSNGPGKPLEPGASSTFEFLIGLQKQETFTFFVNMLGDPQTSNPSSVCGESGFL